MAFRRCNSTNTSAQANGTRRSARSAAWGLVLGVSFCTPGHTQTIELTVEKAELGGIEVRQIAARLHGSTQQATPTTLVPEQLAREGASPSERSAPTSPVSSTRVDLELSFDLDLRSFDAGYSLRPLPIQLNARLDAARWQIRLEPLLIPISSASLTSHRSTSEPTTPSLGLWQADLGVRAEIFGQQTMAPDALHLVMEVANLQYSDASGSVAAEGVGFNTDLMWKASQQPQRSKLETGGFTLRVDNTQGAILAGPVFLDFAAHPLDVMLNGQLHSIAPLQLAVESAELHQRDLLSTKVTAQTRIQTTTRPDTVNSTEALPADIDVQIDSANIELVSLQFPAAYQSFLRTALAGSLLGNLRTTGSLAGTASIRDNALQSGTLLIRDVSLLDQRTQALSIQNLTGNLHWRSEPRTEGAEDSDVSFIGWSSAVLNGIPAQSTRLDFLWHGNDITLTQPARIPILDGALRIETFRAADIALPSQEIVFDGFLEPVSLSTLTQALGWPEFGGTLTGRAPGVRYQDGRLALSGALEADVFGGRISGRDLVIAQPFSRWPRLTVDVTLDNLDLALLTDTFDVGAISGRVAGQISDLELFGWQPVAFDASFATIEDASDPRRISVRAINSIANVGGSAGSGVSSALQSGLLRFFDNYRYRRLGLRCVLRDDVCTMSGTGPDSRLFGDRYTLLEGAGLPRLDIVGYSGRVKWSQLVEQISAQIGSGAAPVRAP